MRTSREFCYFLRKVTRSTLRFKLEYKKIDDVALVWHRYRPVEKQKLNNAAMNQQAKCISIAIGTMIIKLFINKSIGRRLKIKKQLTRTFVAFLGTSSNFWEALLGHDDSSEGASPIRVFVLLLLDCLFALSIAFIRWWRASSHFAYSL